MIEYLSWDSSFFKLKVGRYSVNQPTEEEIFDLYIEKEKNNFDLVYFFCDQITPQFMLVE